jgi:carbonic anhydrase
VAEVNVIRMTEEIKKKSRILREMIDKEEIGIVGGIYNVETGVVEFYDDMNQMTALLNEESAGKY